MLIKERDSIYDAGGERSSAKKQVRKEKAACRDYPGRKKSSQLPKHLQKARSQHAELTNFIENLGGTGSAQRIVKLLLSYQTSYYKQKNSDKSDLYDYILKAAQKESISAQQHVKQDYLAIVQIIQDLKQHVKFNDIIHSISSDTTADVASNIPQASGLKSDDQLAQTRQEPIPLKETGEDTTSFRSTKQSQDIDNKSTQVIKESTEPPLNLSRAKDIARTLHARGDLESEITYIENVIQQCHNAGQPCNYWELLLKVRKSYVQRQKSSVISQIITALQQRTAFYSKCEQDSNSAINQPALQANQPHSALLQNAEYCKQLRVPYWAPTYIYLASELSYANSAQKRFYNHFKEQFLKNIFIDVKGNLNYVYILMYDLADDYMCHRDYTLLKQQLDTLAEKYNIEERYIDNAIRQAVITVKQNDASESLHHYDKAFGQRCRWIASGETMEIQGIKLERGNFYVGECFLLPTKLIKANECSHIYGSVVDPELPIQKDAMEPQIPFCTYRDMTPHQRYEYLMWLSGGIKTSDAPAEILLFYLYGCEIRMFIDPETKKADRRSILSDIISIRHSLNEEQSDRSYQSNCSIRYALDDFIGSAYSKYFKNDKCEFDHVEILKQNAAYQRMVIYRSVKDIQALSAKVIYETALKLYDLDQKIPGKYQPVLSRFFADYFAKEYHDVSITRISQSSYNNRYIKHDNASLFNSEDVTLSYTIPSIDIDVYSIQTIVYDCYHYSISFFREYCDIVKRADGKESVEALFALPQEIDILENPQIKALVDTLHETIERDPYAVMNIDDLLRLCECQCENESSLYKSHIESIQNGLRRLGYGIAPDYELDKKRLNFHNNCVVYRSLDRNQIQHPTEEYLRIDLFIKLAAYIVQGDNILDSDIAAIFDYIRIHGTKLENVEHLYAVAKWRFSSVKQILDQQIKKSIQENLTQKQQEIFGHELILYSCTNGDVRPKRAERLKKILPLLGINADNIHVLIHRTLTDDEGFAVVERKSDAVEYQIGQAKPAEAPKVVINPEKLRIFEQQTKEAQELLSDIFVEDEDQQQANTPSNKPAGTWVDILKLLLTKEIWDRVDIEQECRERGVMLGAVLEQINDFAYSRVDDAVVEDDGEKLYITLAYKEQLI
uniref:TerB N-terminal domain-containing protein n=1 Tax=Alistipes sp. Marseille-P5061 TaxID=2048242 RepID=UPI001319F5A0|nr:TerB N-terminal domain-containing protein [Alistipes sp. Marseille-P5061]